MTTPGASADYVIVGGGVVGLTLALELRRRQSRSRITLLEKEPALGLHASGRNSGVLHAGFYYAADSLKARFTRDGNRRMTEYCTARGLRIRRCGKLVVARDARDHAGLDELYRRGRGNGVALEMVSEAQAREIEPLARTCERALFSPTTSSVDPAEVMRALATDAEDAGIEIRTSTGYVRRRGDRIETTTGTISGGYLINAAGLYADRIARDHGFAEHYEILPFKGLYLKGDAGAPAFRTHVYPVPDLGRPFLDVHVTVTAGGAVKLGPTAIPAFWREHYTGLQNFDALECASIVSREAALFVRNDFGFRRHAVTEIRRYGKRHLVSAAAAIARDLRAEQFTHWGPPGIRAQLLDTRTNKLEMDFKFEGDDRSFHVLNAVSPAFTCSLAFSEYLVDEMERLCA